MTRYEEEGDDMFDGAARSAPKAKTGFGARLSKLFGGGKSAAEPSRHRHHEFGKVGHIQLHSVSE